MKPLCAFFLSAAFFASSGFSQETESEASVTSAIDQNGAGKIVVEARGKIPEPPTFYSSEIKNVAKVHPNRIDFTASATVRFHQGKGSVVRFWTRGVAEVVSVKGETVSEWAVRWDDKKRRYIDVTLLREEEKNPEHAFTIQMREEVAALPKSYQMTHFVPAGAAMTGLSQTLTISYAPGVEGRVAQVEGFVSVKTDEDSEQAYQGSSGGKFLVKLFRSGTETAPVEWRNFRMSGRMHPNGKSAGFLVEGTALVSEKGATARVLWGKAAFHTLPKGGNFRVELDSIGNGTSAYNLIFDEPGEWPFSFEFTAPVFSEKEWSRLQFSTASGAVAPVIFQGLPKNVEFRSDSSIALQGSEKDAVTRTCHLPADGDFHLAWKPTRAVEKGALFYNTTAVVESFVSAGILRQTHTIDYRILQGALEKVVINVEGAGEILDVQGTQVVSWSVEGDEMRRLILTLSQPVSETAQFVVQSQLPLSAFPVEVTGMILTPESSVRHSGHLRLSNVGNVRIEPSSTLGLIQLSPEQFPGKALEARQVFSYRFPASEHELKFLADRIQPEVAVSELVLYEMAESDRVIRADIELDVREASIREWDLEIPGDYSIVAVTGAAVTDYVPASASEGAMRNLKVIFNADVMGRQLIRLHLEKNEAASAGEWQLPALRYPGAKSVRGDIGAVGSPGIRIAHTSSESLSEIPLAYFPKQTSNLQQAFRIRESGWSAQMEVELLEKSIQADVFHLYSLSEGTAFGSVLMNFFIAGAPTSEFQISVPEELGNVSVEGKEVRSYRHEEGTLLVTLHQSVIGAYTLLITFEEKLESSGGAVQLGRVAPLGIEGERGYLQLVSPHQLQLSVKEVSEDLLHLDALELPAEFRLLTAAPSLGAWQYTERPFVLEVGVDWFVPGSTATQLVEFSEVKTRVSTDGELVSDIIYDVKSRGRLALKLQLPKDTKLWSVTVAGETVTARQSGEDTLIPLPGGTDSNQSVEVKLRIGRTAVDGKTPQVELPRVDAPILKTEWQLQGDRGGVLIPAGGTVEPVSPILPATGLDQLAKRSLVPFLGSILLLGLGCFFLRRKGAWNFLACSFLFVFVLSLLFLAKRAFETAIGFPGLEVSLPNLAPNELVAIGVEPAGFAKMNLTLLGIFSICLGVVGLVVSFLKFPRAKRNRNLTLSGFLLVLGVLLQRNSEGWFYVFLAILISAFLLFPLIGIMWRDLRKRRQRARESVAAAKGDTSASGAVSLLLGGLLVFCAPNSGGAGQEFPPGFSVAGEIQQEWMIEHEKSRLSGKGEITVSGKKGDRFILLREPAVLTGFEGSGLQVDKQQIEGFGLCYVLRIEKPSEPVFIEVNPFGDGNEGLEGKEAKPEEFRAKFTFETQIGNLKSGFPLPTGVAAVQKVAASYNRGGWNFVCPAAVRVEPIDAGSEKVSAAALLLAPQEKVVIHLQPEARDLASEERQFFVESKSLYLPSPGVVDGRHRFEVRVARGQVEALQVRVPSGHTVSDVKGPISSWKFDAENGDLQLAVDPAQSKTFSFEVTTQIGLASLPSDLELSPLIVSGASGEVGFVALAFGSDAQPEKVETETLSRVTEGDFGRELIPDETVSLYRVYRYGSNGGSLVLRVAPVAPEVRVASKQILSLGDERVVLSLDLTAEITRSGVFQLGFVLPEGYEVESLSGGALHHWSELSENGERKIVMHLQGKTLGVQNFSATLVSNSPEEGSDWEIPNVSILEASRQTGQLVIKPTTGIRLRTESRQNVSETDPGSLGDRSKGALAYRLLQRDWELVLGVEKLEPWVTAELLHEVTLREGQTKTVLFGKVKVDNASVRSLELELPELSDEEVRSVYASGDAVSDLVRVSPDSNQWVLEFSRRVIGEVSFRIEYEKRGERSGDREALHAIRFPGARQVSYFVAVRSGGRLELETADMPRGWQEADWSSVPQGVRNSGQKNSPALTLRMIDAEEPLTLLASRHSIAEALKLRVSSGELTTVLSPLGDQLTGVDLRMEVVQRSSLSVVLPKGGELFSIFVNGESVHSVRQGDAWRFYILPGEDDKTATVRFVYSLSGDRIHQVGLLSPQLNIPLENISWSVVAPRGFDLIANRGDLELTKRQDWVEYDRAAYLRTAKGRRDEQAKKAEALLEKANDLLQAGEQSKASWAFNSVANQYALDAASNEDARVQLENLQMQQALVGLNTRRQRLFLHRPGEVPNQEQKDKIEAGIIGNRILQEGDLNFRPQEMGQLLMGNTTEDNAALQRIAARLVAHQRTTLPAPQTISVTLPKEGTIYTFHRTVQVAENASLGLELKFDRASKIGFWRLAGALLLCALAFVLIWLVRRKR